MWEEVTCASRFMFLYVHLPRKNGVKVNRRITNCKVFQGPLQLLWHVNESTN